MLSLASRKLLLSLTILSSTTTIPIQKQCSVASRRGSLIENDFTFHYRPPSYKATPQLRKSRGLLPNQSHMRMGSFRVINSFLNNSSHLSAAIPRPSPLNSKPKPSSFEHTKTVSHLNSTRALSSLSKKSEMKTIDLYDLMNAKRGGTGLYVSKKLVEDQSLLMHKVVQFCAQTKTQISEEQRRQLRIVFI